MPQNVHDQRIASKVSQLRLSAIKDMAMRSAALDDVVSLAWGLPSFSTPEYIRNAVKQQLDEDRDIGKYALPDGLLELRKLVASRHKKETGVTVDPDTEVMITAGNMQAMNTLFHVLIDAGDEIILTDPCFVSHIQQIKLCGGKPVFWGLDESRGWCLDVDALSPLISDKTKAIVLVSPSNPTGRVFNKQNLLRIGRIARDHGVMIIIDDPYSHFLYENREKYFNLACVEEFKDNVVYCYSFSKAYAMSGWRLGYMILPAFLKQHVVKVHDMNMICTPRVSQVAGVAALSGVDDHQVEFENILASRRQLMCDRLDALSHVFDYHRPEGAYYVFPRILLEHDNDYDFCIDLLESARVSLTPGSAFGPGGAGHVRMAFCVAEQQIDLAFDRMEKYFGV